ncbi:hypothetical protein Q787_04920 [Ornithobacterium rhinotracheale H06-030791]|nr:hypothetical protein Q785_05045 [Ornithobacterium rhinotracheale ORT-UMN 88]KGB67416.1 hypothetical protein Q787_04920 [Ornithobacterium rhinotracheale H06-030791]
MKKSILQCATLQKHKAKAPNRNFGFCLFIQYSIASTKLVLLFFIFKLNGKLFAQANNRK